ncbi:hypothetical protein HXX76_012931 [Chlamydomonas incerta]|uniref:POPLD domain-containing protein n=1 Tax=Chlamydomonas incerta TaxID=51695 RepID=A0A835SJC4_CHLIN|nr:hypothetical protein HXX76_012931 [Chlamydomonas incerta]|eukprot:KAG2426616.1 hypothetical protein HXX76_012931 [Chlamydomonas incerta]
MTAETPRVLDVRDFAQARETELRYLLQAVRSDVGEARFGAALLPRHLRRRATSHRRFVVKRRPNTRLAALYAAGAAAAAAATAAAAVGAKWPTGTAAGGVGTGTVTGGTGPARRVRARISTAGGGGGGATAPPGEEAGDRSAGSGRVAQAAQAGRPTNRAMRRRPARLQAQVEASCAVDLAPPPGGPAAGTHVGGGAGVSTGAGDAAAEAGASAGSAGAGDGAPLRRLESHVWHARRMAMEARGSSSGSGGGGGLLLHDASYCGCVQLSGHQARLAELLRRVSDPARLDALLQRADVICGAAEWGCVVHTPGAFPAGALAPARALWLQHHSAAGSSSSGTAPGGGGGGGGVGAAQVAAAEADVDAEGWATQCHLWLWVHAAAFGDVWRALHQAAASLDSTGPGGASAASAAVAGGVGGGGGGCGGSVRIQSRCADLRRLEVVGARAGAALAAVLQPVACGSGSSSSGSGSSGGDSDLGAQVWSGVWRSRSAAGCGSGSSTGASRRWPAGAVLGLRAADPRLAAPVRAGVLAVAVLDAPSPMEVGEEAAAAAVAATSAAAVAATALDDRALARQLAGWPEAGDWTAGGAGLWAVAAAEAGGGDESPRPSPPPLPEAQVGAARADARRQLLDAGLACGHGGGGGSSGGAAAGAAAAGFATSCPLLLVKRAPSTAAARAAAAAGGAAAVAAAEAEAGWSVVLPARWVLPFWLALVYQGGRAAGQQEWRQLHSHWRAPCFPYDHPYTPAGAALAAARRAELATAAAARPLGRAPHPADCSPLADWRGLGRAVAEDAVAGGGSGRDTLLLIPEDLRGHKPSRRGRWKAGEQAAQLPAAAGAAAPESASASLADQPAAAAAAAPLAATAAAAAVAADAHDAAAALRGLPVAHSLHSLRRALAPHPAQRSTVQDHNGSSKGHAGVRGSSSAGISGSSSGSSSSSRKDRLYGWTLRKAIRQGLIPAAALAAPAAAGADADAGAGAGAGAGGHRSCLVHASVRVVGRGVCEAGAELLARLPATAGDDAGGGRSGADTSNGVESSAMEVELEVDGGGVGDGGLRASGPADAAAQEQVRPKAAAAAVPLVRVGYVTSAAPRGSPGYPGGLAMCEAGCLAQAWAAQLQRDAAPGHGGGGDARAQGPPLALAWEQAVAAWLLGGLEGSKATTGGAASGAARAGGRVGGGGGASCVLRLWLRNPESAALRACEVQVLLG